MEQKRCDWAVSNPLERQYHDEEWGVPKKDDRELFELLVLESMQAGLSWSTILSKRETLTKAFSDFDPVKVAAYSQAKVEELLQDPGVIRHRLKIEATITNAKTFLKIQAKYGDFSSYIWEYVNNQPLVNQWEVISQVPSKTPLSEKISKELKKEGFKFLGPTTVYSFLQAAGLVNDHLITCFKK